MKASRGQRRSGEAARAHRKVSGSRARRGASAVIAQYIQDLTRPPRPPRAAI
jgi:hypothetical protein